MGIKAVVYKEESLCEKAASISLKTGAPFLKESDLLIKDFKNDDYLFFLSKKCFEIKKFNSNERGLFVNFFSNDMIRRIKTGNYKNPLCKAIGLNSKTKNRFSILDATAGLGRDSFFLYSLGGKIAGFERNTYLFYLLEKGYSNFIKSNEYFNNDPCNLLFLNVDSKDYFKDFGSSLTTDAKKSLNDFLKEKPFDIVYLDPMYPPKKKKSAKPKKEMSYLKDVVGSDFDGFDLFSSCLNKNLKIVVKRPVYAKPVSGDLKPSYFIDSKMVRYDVYA